MQPIHIRIILSLLICLTCSIATCRASTNGWIFLGPTNSGTPGSGDPWLHGAKGTATTLVDFDDAPKNGFDLALNNSEPGKENAADWRSEPFPLGAAVGGSRPMTFSFAYKLVNPVLKGNNVHVQLRFFDATGTNFISEHVFPIGARSGDSSMADYKIKTIENIHAPPNARTADVWVDANIFEPWNSGTARFADFSLTVAPRSLAFKAGIIALVCAVIGMSAGISIFFWRRRVQP